MREWVEGEEAGCWERTCMYSEKPVVLTFAHRSFAAATMCPSL